MASAPTTAAVETPERPDTEPFEIQPPYDVTAEDLPPDRFLDRELSWLAFNARVLELAEDESLPLLERVRFAAIFASNLDEFFMVRVAGLKRRIAAGVAVRAASGMRPREVLSAIWAESRVLMERHSCLFQEKLRPALTAEGIELLRWEDLTKEERGAASEIFRERLYPC
jgi:polyphosphate kinase